jgi:uncharacterized membrane protein
MLRDILGLICGGLAGILIGAIVGYSWSGLMGSSMLGLAGLLPGAFVGWRLSLMFPGRPTDQGLVADYDDGPTAPDHASTHS